MTELKNDRFLRALLRQDVDVTPVWMMRQAGRYLPEYRAVREKAGDFMSLCRNPELACEVTLQPLRRYALDAAILFSDILTIPDAMGLGLYFAAGEGPKFRKPVQTPADVEALDVVDTEKDLGYVLDAVRLIRRELNGSVPLIGFSGSPWTVATYMVEGGSSKEFARIKSMLMNTPEVMHQLLEKLAQSVTGYLNAQILAGVQAVQIFDTWGGAQLPCLPGVFPVLHEENRSRADSRAGWTENTGHPVHQKRRPLAGSDRGKRLRLHWSRLDAADQ